MNSWKGVVHLFEDSTLFLIKPDALRRGLAGAVVSRLPEGLQVTEFFHRRLTTAEAADLYQEHEGKAFFPALVDFMTSGPVMAFWLNGPQAVERVREALGAAKPERRIPGTIRADFGARGAPFGRTWLIVRIHRRRRYGN